MFDVWHTYWCGNVFFWALICSLKALKRIFNQTDTLGGGLISNFELSLFQSYTKLFSGVIEFCTKSPITENDIKNYRRDIQDLSETV